MKLLGEFANVAFGHACVIKEGEDYIPVEEWEIGETYAVGHSLIYDDTERPMTVKLVKETDHPNANLFVEFKDKSGYIKHARLITEHSIFKKIVEAGLGTTFVTNRPFTVPNNQILIKGILYPSVKRANPKILDLLDNKVMADDGFYATLDDTDMKAYNEYLTKCITLFQGPKPTPEGVFVKYQRRNKNKK